MSTLDATSTVSRPDQTERLRAVLVKRAERELLFWTIRQVFGLLLLAAIVLHVALGLLEGLPPCNPLAFVIQG
jgi:hypothetical protein